MANPCTFRSVDVSGYHGIELANDALALTVVPEIGGKIISIYHKRAAREWLARNPHLLMQLPPYDGAFVETFDSGGLDECFPSVAAVTYPVSPWQNSVIPDHGELWCQPWDVAILAHPDQVTLDMSCNGVRLPYRFERNVTLSAHSAAITLNYRVTNHSRFDMPFVWSIHPILQIEEGMCLSLPAEVSRLRIDSSTDDTAGKAGDECSWPLLYNRQGKTLDLSRIPPPHERRAMKLFTPPLHKNTVAEAVLWDGADLHCFGFRFRTDEISHVGLWMNYGGWSGSGATPYYNLGLEPCIGGADSLIMARQLGEYGTLVAKQCKAWSLEIFLN